MIIKRNFLILAFATVSTIAFLYGISPTWFARAFLDVAEPTVDFTHILRAVMCLYLGFGLFWLASAFNDRYRDTAVLTTVVFAGGLVVGRIVSFLVDGPPSLLLAFYGMLELALVPVAYWVFTRPE